MLSVRRAFSFLTVAFLHKLANYFLTDAKDRFLRSDESSELNTLLKHYQRDLETLSASETEAAYASYHHPSSHPSATPNRSNAGNTNTNNSGSGTEVDHQLVVALLRYIMHSEFGHHLGSNAAASGKNESPTSSAFVCVLIYVCMRCKDDCVLTFFDSSSGDVTITTLRSHSHVFGALLCFVMSLNVH